MTSTCYLSDDFSLWKTYLSEVGCDTLAPESLANEKQIMEWVASLLDKPLRFATCSLFLLRELELQKIPCIFVNLRNGEVHTADSLYDIGDIEILQRELSQSDRYMEQARAEDIWRMEQAKAEMRAMVTKKEEQL